jgi:hypothetical protein
MLTFALALAILQAPLAPVSTSTAWPQGNVVRGRVIAPPKRTDDDEAKKRTSAAHGRVLGSVIDDKGLPVFGLLSLRAFHLPLTTEKVKGEGEKDAIDPQLVGTPVPVQLSGTTYRVQDVPAGRVWIYADSALWGESSASAAVVPDRVRRAHIVYPVDQSNALEFVFQHDAGHPHLDVEDTVRLHADLAVRTPRKLEVGHCRFLFENLHVARWELEVESPYYGPVTSFSRPGGSREVRLRPPCSLQLTVVDASTRLEITEYTLTLKNHWDRSIDWSTWELIRSPDGVFSNVPCNSPAFDVTAPGYCSERLRPTGKKTADSRWIETAALHPARSLRGRVVDAHGRAVPGAKVSIDVRRGTARNRERQWGHKFRKPEPIEATATGHFSFYGLHEGEYVLTARHTTLPLATRSDVRVDATSARTTLALPAVGTLHGRLLGAAPERRYILAEPIEVMGPSTAARLDTDGRFTLTDLPVGRLRLSIHHKANGRHYLDVIEIVEGENEWELTLEE